MAKSQRVHLLNRQRKLKLESDALRSLVKWVLEGEGADPDCHVELVLLRDGPMAELNAQYRGRSGATDVLAFQTDPEGWPAEEAPLWGTVVVSVDRAVQQASERGLKTGAEIRRLVVHGLLHLAGYRDGTPAERARMRRRENRYLQPRTRRR
ncbi:MAG: rRNA maturation RNase YbeY [Candidatus Eisenbacteria sp.]|nr:rRNA maturation RNase YbeY [Candidatus Eisenbacteria bacterium]